MLLLNINTLSACFVVDENNSCAHEFAWNDMITPSPAYKE